MKPNYPNIPPFNIIYPELRYGDSGYYGGGDGGWKAFKIIIGIIIGLIILGIGTFTYHHHKYKCIRGHYYKDWNPIPPPHWETYWQCDEEILRTEYEKNPSKYPKSECGCQ